MGKKKQAPARPLYDRMADTPWIKQGRDIALAGGKGILDNYNKVNVFDADTNRSIDARNSEIYRRAFDDMERNYTNTMNKYAANNYNRFGTLNATGPSFVTDNYQRQFQRQMNDLAFNKAMNYDKLKDLELSRRYDTLNMFGNMYGYGKTPYEQDKMNWNVDQTNKDIMYQNQLANFANRSGGWQGALKGGLEGAVKGFATTGNPWGAVAGGAAGAIGGAM